MEHNISVTDWPIINTIYNAIQLFYSLNTSKISLKITEVSSGPSITMHIAKLSEVDVT